MSLDTQIIFFKFQQTQIFDKTADNRPYRPIPIIGASLTKNMLFT